MTHRERHKATQTTLSLGFGREAQMNSSQTEDLLQAWESRNLFSNPFWQKHYCNSEAAVLLRLSIALFCM